MLNNSVTQLVVDLELIRRLDKNGPRYTSYPTADRFVEAFNAETYSLWLAKREIGGIARPLSLYIHIPFCNTLCFYCACNKVITKDRSKSAEYVRYLIKEMQMQAKLLGERQVVEQLHFGGGTPTFLSDDEIRQVMAAIRENFKMVEDGEYSIEIDPRRVTEKDIALLAELGFNRISLGVQDFNLAVQEAVHRVQTIEETQAVMDWSRKYGFKSRSVDLIYGLPKQTPETFKETVDTVLAMNPDRLSVYNYAHLPHIFKPQRRISEAELPPAADKLDILSNTIARLGEAGYVFIGMDHFAKPDDELAIAQKEGKLHRNFQGYSTQAECDLLAFGISSIGKVDDCYSQNVRTLDEYYAALDQGHLPVLIGLQLNPDDLLRRELIGELMCQFALNTESFANAHHIDFSSYFKVELEELKGLEDAGLLEWQGTSMQVPIKGRLLARRVAMTFDRHLRESQAKGTYSKVL